MTRAIQLDRVETDIISKCWNILASLWLTFFVLLLLVADLTLGYFCLDGQITVFEPLNEVGLFQWLRTYGTSDLRITGWFIALLPLLLVLALNTTACAVEKLVKLFRVIGHQFAREGFQLKLAVHVVHIAMVLILAGYLTSYCISRVYSGLTVIENGTTRVTGTELRLQLVAMEPIAYTTNRLASYEGRYIDVDATVQVTKRDQLVAEGVIGVNRPLRFDGYGIYLTRFNPKSSTGMSPSKYIIVSVRKDPGVLLTVTGLGIFAFGLVWYVIMWSRIHLWRKNNP